MIAMFPSGYLLYFLKKSLIIKRGKISTAGYSRRTTKSRVGICRHVNDCCIELLASNCFK
jgi:hypothetical protein